MCPGPAAPANNASGFVNARISVPRDGWTPSPPVRASAAPPIPSCAHPRPRYGVRAASWARPGNWPGPLRIGLERPIAVDAVPHCRPGACRAPASCHPTMTAVPDSPAPAAFSSCARRLRSPWSPGCCARPRSESARRAGVMASTTLTTRPPVGTSSLRFQAWFRQQLHPPLRPAWNSSPLASGPAAFSSPFFFFEPK